MSSPTNRRRVRRYRIGDWQVNESDGTLRAAGECRRLQPRAAELLAFLVRRPGRVVEREELLRSVWADAHVHEIALTRTVSELRKALDDDAHDPRYIETIPKRGYRLIAAVRPLRDTVEGGVHPTSTRTRPSWSRAAALLLVATLVASFLLADTEPEPAGPVTLQVGSPARELLARGEEYYGRQSFRDNENALRLFREALVREPELARARAALAGATAQKARYEGYPSELIDRAVELGRDAVVRAPRSPDAHWSLGLAYSTRGWLRGAEGAYRIALELDPDHVRARNNLAAVLWRRGRRVEAVEQTIDLLARGAGTATGVANLASMLSGLGFDEEARRWFERALLLEPTRAATVVSLAEHEALRGGAAAARRRLDALLRVDPGCADCLAARARLELREATFTDAAPFIEGWHEAEPQWPPARLYRVLLARSAEPGSVAASLERIESEARAYRDGGTESWWAPWCLAAVASLRGDRGVALASIEEAVDRGLADWRQIVHEPLFAWLAEDPRLAALLSQLRRREAEDRRRVRELGLLERLPS